VFSAEGREATFKDRWGLDGNKSARKMAQAGFFRPIDENLVYLKVKDAVACAYCGVCIGDWEPEDIPLIEHVKWYPRCRFMRHFPRGCTIRYEFECLMRLESAEECSRSRKEYPWLFGA